VGGGEWAAGGRFAAVDEVDGAGDADDLLAQLGRWREDQDAAEAARSRTKERWLRQQAAEAARLSAVALDLAERGTPVTLSTTAGGTHTATVAGVAREFVVLRSSGDRLTFVRWSCVAAIRPPPGDRAGEADADRDAPLDLLLGHALAGLAADRPRVRIVTAGGAEPWTGELRAVGGDVLTLRLDGGDGPACATVYLALDAVCEVTVLG